MKLQITLHVRRIFNREISQILILRGSGIVLRRQSDDDSKAAGSIPSPGCYLIVT